MSAPIGSVYVLSNAATPGWFKVGATVHHPIQRARQLSASSGVPVPYVVAYHRAVPFPFEAESWLHRMLADYRINDSREFFAVELSKIIMLMETLDELVYSSDIKTPFAELFATFPDGDSGRELTDDEQAKCRALEAELATQ